MTIILLAHGAFNVFVAVYCGDTLYPAALNYFLAGVCLMAAAWHWTA